MTLIVEDPWPLIWICAFAIPASLLALRVTQQGKFLFLALGALGLAALLLLIDTLVVTDTERIEQTLEQLIAATRRSDGDAFNALLTTDVSLGQNSGSTNLSGAAARAVIKATLEATEFDFITIGKRAISAGRLTRQGTADFRVFTAGTIQGTRFGTNPNEGSDWSLGFREVDGAWKVSRITAVRLPSNASLPLVQPASP